MSSPNFGFRFMGGVLLVAVLASCSSPTPTLAPTVDIQPTLNAVQTQSAGTVIADLTQNAPTATLPLPAPTEDIRPTLNAVKTQSAGTVIAHLTQNAPAATATVKATVKATLPWWTKTPTQPAGGCAITEFSPKLNAIYAPNDDFDAVWMIKNTGDTTWLQNNTDIRYSSGAKLQKSVDSVDLSNDVAGGESYQITLDMRAPTDAGTYTTTWVVYTGDQLVCTMNMTIIVK